MIIGEKMKRIKLKIEDKSTKWDALLFTDPHIYGKNPLCRLDDLTEKQFEKLDEIKTVANRYKVPVLCMGDITESPNIGYGTFTSLSYILQEIERNLYFVYGQHDLFWHDIGSSESTATGALEVSLSNVRRIREFRFDHGIGFDYANWGEEIQKSGYRYLMTHIPVVSRGWVSKFDFLKFNVDEKKYLYVEDLYKDYNLILCGDWHRRYIFNYKNCTVINPGALTRRKADQDAKNTFPSYVLLQFHPLKYEVMPLQCAEPFENVISDDHLQYGNLRRDTVKEIESFVQILKTQLTNSENKTTFKQRLMERMNDLPNDVKKVVRVLLSEVYGGKVGFEPTVKLGKRLQLRSK